VARPEQDKGGNKLRECSEQQTALANVNEKKTDWHLKEGRS
jgi:hypothetical protein